MAKIKKTIFINAPLEKVFAFMAEPNNLLEVWPSLIEVRNVQPLPGGGYCYNWAYKIAGMRFDGQAEWIEFVKNQRVVDKNEIGIPSTFTWDYQPTDGGTCVTFEAEYTLPGNVLDKLVERVIHRINEHESVSVLANLKVLMEG